MMLLQLFGVLFLVNLFTIGGGYVMLPLLHDFLSPNSAGSPIRNFLTQWPWGRLRLAR